MKHLQNHIFKAIYVTEGLTKITTQHAFYYSGKTDPYEAYFFAIKGKLVSQKSDVSPVQSSTITQVV